MKLDYQVDYGKNRRLRKGSANAIEKWCIRQDLNLQPSDPKSDYTPCS